MNGSTSHPQRPMSPPSYPPPPASLHTGLQRQSRSSGESLLFCCFVWCEDAWTFFRLFFDDVWGSPCHLLQLQVQLQRDSIHDLLQKRQINISLVSFLSTSPTLNLKVLEMFKMCCFMKQHSRSFFGIWLYIWWVKGSLEDVIQQSTFSVIFATFEYIQSHKVGTSKFGGYIHDQRKPNLCLLFLFLLLEGSESVTRESVVSGHTSVSTTVPIARFSEEEKKVSVIKAPHYEGIGPVDESGIPIAIRTVRSCIQTVSVGHRGGTGWEWLLTDFCCLDMWSGSQEWDYFQLSAAFDPFIKSPFSPTLTISVSLLLFLCVLVIKISFSAAMSSLLTCQRVCASVLSPLRLSLHSHFTQSSAPWGEAFKARRTEVQKGMIRRNRKRGREKTYTGKKSWE